jgi:hypothetical protein
VGALIVAKATTKADGTETPSAAFKAGDVVELCSGSFPMTVLEVCPGDPSHVHLMWDRNGLHSGRACCLSRASLPMAACKAFVPYDQRTGADNVPF